MLKNTSWHFSIFLSKSSKRTWAWHFVGFNIHLNIIFLSLQTTNCNKTTANRTIVHSFSKTAFGAFSKTSQELPWTKPGHDYFHHHFTIVNLFSTTISQQKPWCSHAQKSHSWPFSNTVQKTPHNQAWLLLKHHQNSIMDLWQSSFSTCRSLSTTVSNLASSMAEFIWSHSKLCQGKASSSLIKE